MEEFRDLGPVPVALLIQRAERPGVPAQRLHAAGVVRSHDQHPALRRQPARQGHPLVMPPRPLLQPFRVP